jgi:FixJ family two-component response regulator
MDDVLTTADGARSRRRVAFPGQQKVIAVVDDDAPVCRALGRLLRSAGYEVEMFASGPEFLLSVPTRPPDCLLLDLSMPVMNGLEVLARLAGPERGVPVVIITGRTDKEPETDAAQDAGTAVLRKPVDDTKLLDAVAVAISSPGPGSGQS